MYIWRHTSRRQVPAAVWHNVKSLLPWGTAAGAWFRQQGGAVRRQGPTAERHGGKVFFIFFVFHF
jgi:hypothetical protein